MGQSVVIKKEENVKLIFSELGADCTFADFEKKFLAEYPDDWDKINKRYRKHERKIKKEKGTLCLSLHSI